MLRIRRSITANLSGLSDADTTSPTRLRAKVCLLWLVFATIATPGLAQGDSPASQNAGQLAAAIQPFVDSHALAGAVMAVAGGASASPRMPSTNLVALRVLMASLRPIFIWPGSRAVSTPGLALDAQ